jgi:adenosylcobinamide-phosphate synthase
MLAIALILDAIFGEPEWLWRRIPHPAVLMGRAVAWVETRLNKGEKRHIKGVAAVVVIIAITLAVTAPLGWSGFHGVIEVLGAAILLAQRSLSQHVYAVAAALNVSLDEGRKKVAMIVGRDPETLDESGVARAAAESAAENWSDGVIAPAFWFLVAGLPGIAVYKMVNTADSMIGHRNERYAEFGWAAARLDDLLNLIPARLSGLLICLIGGKRPALKIMWRDARKHKSPNAGWPESALAATLKIALAGPRVYDGVKTDDPFLNPEGRRELNAIDVSDAMTTLWMAWTVVLVVAIVVSVLYWSVVS